MEQQRDIILVDTSEIINIVHRSLCKIDSRLVDHGQRVAYIATQIYAACGGIDDVDPTRLFVLCVLHDIGAYKTNEIDDMVRFETERPYDHAFYGYLFLKNTFHLADYAEALLYHHTDYAKLRQENPPCSAYAQLIYLADRVDILLHSSHPDLELLRLDAGRKFNPAYVEALFRVENSYGLTRRVVSESYKAENRLLLRDFKISNQEIMDYLRLLVFAIDFRSPYTVTHTMDTTIISLETGKLLGLNDRELQVLYVGAFLHDIGKIAIPHAILEKPGKLTPEEFAVIRQHIPEGESILRGVVSDEICDVALRHHEKLDGSGYALGLRGEQLTRSQRIVAVADICSALYQPRSYKPAFPKEKVLTILRRFKEQGQLCPQVVDTMCANYDLILKKTAESHDPIKALYSNLLREYTARYGPMDNSPSKTART